jgi:hypothetical protein
VIDTPLWFERVGFALNIAFIPAIPIAIGIAILRYRLYDIDLLINRTLVYGSLTLMLALVYFGGVTATQALFTALTSQEEQPQLAIVVSTLVIAALFNPLDRAGTSYRYRVSEVLVVDPTDSWVMGQVRGRDMVTLQTCTPYPTFEKRLIVRADRV